MSRIIILLSLLNLAAQAELVPNPTLTSGMVFQRGKPIVLWGTASPGSTVSGTIGAETIATTVAQSGEWQLELSPRPASTRPIAIRLTSGSDTSTIEDVLIGDVWFCAGQSNMVMPLGRTDGNSDAVNYAGNDQIRFLRMIKSPFTKPITPSETEKLAPTPANKASFYRISPWESADSGKRVSLSAVAYWFARSLHEEMEVPIGLIVPPLGGSAVQAWVSRASFDNDPALRPLLDRWIADESPGLKKQFAPWLEANPESDFDATPLHRHRPTTLFESAVQPMSRHAVRGVIWYQGEYNAENTVQAKWHQLAFPHLIADFRRNWSQPALPVFYVQLPGFGRNAWPDFREQQRQFLKIPHLGMAVTVDLGSEKNIHPKDKAPVGRRLALLAFKHAYGKKLQADSPVPSRVYLEQPGTVRIQFSEVGTSLKSESPKLVPGFEVAGADGVFKRVTARLINNTTVELTTDQPAPRRVRYAWAGYPRPLSLANSADLPAGPFLEPIP